MTTTFILLFSLGAIAGKVIASIQQNNFNKNVRYIRDTLNKLI